MLVLGARVPVKRAGRTDNAGPDPRDSSFSRRLDAFRALAFVNPRVRRAVLRTHQRQQQQALTQSPPANQNASNNISQQQPHGSEQCHGDADALQSALDQAGIIYEQLPPDLIQQVLERPSHLAGCFDNLLVEHRRLPRDDFVLDASQIARLQDEHLPNPLAHDSAQSPSQRAAAQEPSTHRSNDDDGDDDAASHAAPQRPQQQQQQSTALNASLPALSHAQANHHKQQPHDPEHRPQQTTAHTEPFTATNTSSTTNVQPDRPANTPATTDTAPLTLSPATAIAPSVNTGDTPANRQQQQPPAVRLCCGVAKKRFTSCAICGFAGPAANDRSPTLRAGVAHLSTKATSSITRRRKLTKHSASLPATHKKIPHLAKNTTKPKKSSLKNIPSKNIPSKNCAKKCKNNKRSKKNTQRKDQGQVDLP